MVAGICLPWEWNKLKCKIKFSGKFILILLASIILIQLLLATSYYVYNYERRLEDYKIRIMDQIVDTLRIMRASPIEKTRLIAKVSEIHDFSVDVTIEPLSSIKSDSENYYVIKKIVEKNFNAGHISVQLDDGRWANFEFRPTPAHYLLQLVILILEFFVAGILLFFAWYIERFTAPLHKFKAAAERLGVQLRPEPIVEYGPAIVKETADAMNQMQHRIIQLLQDRNTMLAAISHDLRTPLTRLRLRTQFVKDKNLVKESITDIEEMEHMIEQILTFTKDASRQEAQVDLDLVALLQTLCDDQADLGNYVSFKSDCQRLAFHARPLAIKRAFSNIINNAVSYATQVCVELEKTDSDIKVKIADNGPGIPEDQLTKVFTPFYRVDSSRSPKKGGCGLGLAIVHDIINDHDGIIFLNNLPSHGLAVTICFPIP